MIDEAVVLLGGVGVIIFALIATTFREHGKAILSLDRKLSALEAELALVREMRHDETPTLAEGWQENREAHNAESE